MDFEDKLGPQDFRMPICSEAGCLRNTAPEVLYPLILGFLQSMTGQDWEVRIASHDVDNMGEMLTVKASVNMSIAKNKFGAVSDPLIVPKETK